VKRKGDEPSKPVKGTESRGNQAQGERRGLARDQLEREGETKKKQKPTTWVGCLSVVEISKILKTSCDTDRQQRNAEKKKKVKRTGPQPE